jgi:hypothetical protein
VGGRRSTEARQGVKEPRRVPVNAEGNIPFPAPPRPSGGLPCLPDSITMGSILSEACMPPCDAPLCPVAESRVAAGLFYARRRQSGTIRLRASFCCGAPPYLPCPRARPFAPLDALPQTLPRGFFMRTIRSRLRSIVSAPFCAPQPGRAGQPRA